jgi:hypothetical protein
MDGNPLGRGMQHRKTMSIGQGMALAGILQLAVLSQPASADAYRCKGKSGLAVISTASGLSLTLVCFSCLANDKRVICWFFYSIYIYSSSYNLDGVFI